jgi:hypothetical protein
MKTVIDEKQRSVDYVKKHAEFFAYEEKCVPVRKKNISEHAQNLSFYISGN